MDKEIRLVDEKHIVIIETETTERRVSKINLRRRKAALLEQIAETDELLTYFSQTEETR